MKDARGARELPLYLKASLFAGSGLIRAMAATWRYRVLRGDVPAGLRASGTPILFTLWHGEMLPLLWHHRNEGVTVLVSEHKDGEVIAQLLDWLGYRLVRGSTSRGAGRALIGIVRTLRSGGDVAITPDGPRGPRHQFAPGAAVAASRAGAPVVPAVAHVDRFWRLETWDGFIIPKPFARITVAYGDPAWLDSSAPRDAAAAAPHLENLMAQAGRLACG